MLKFGLICFYKEVFIKGNNKGPRLNDQIRLTECRLVGDDGEQFGIVTLSEAKRISDDKGLDLLEMSPNAKPPVVKLIDYGKFKYESQKKANEAKQKQLVIQVKEIQFRPNIEVHDLETKLKRAEKFLSQGDKIKMVMQFRGRENAYKDIGKQKFDGIVQSVVEMGAVIEQDASLQGNRIICVVAAEKKIIKEAQQKAKELAAKKAKEKLERKAQKHNK